MARAPPLQGGCRGFESLWAHVNKPTVAELADLLEKRYPKSLAVEWDVVGLITGNQELLLDKILLTVDITKEVIQEAIDLSVNLIISHHPLILDSNENSDIQSKRLELKSIIEKNSIALFILHTNADIAINGVNDSFAELLGLKEVRAIGTEKMARIGLLPVEMTLKELAKKIQEILPSNKSAIQVSGILNQKIKTVALCGGSGSSLLEQIRQTEAEVYVTADLKHHVVSDNKTMNGPCLISVSHWASEWVWLPQLKQQLENDFKLIGKNTKIVVSNIVTDPWDYSLGFDK